MKDKIIYELIHDLAENYRNDKAVLDSIVEDTINDALRISNRYNKTDKENQLEILKSNIKKATKTIYLQRGVEDVRQNSENGLSNVYDQAIETMQKDIIREGKRIFV